VQAVIKLPGMGATGAPAAAPARGRQRVRAASLPLLELTAVGVAAAVALAWAIWQPPVRDLAAHLFRIEQFEATGPHLWNNFWYGGHVTPGYSALFPPVAAAIGIGATGMLSAMLAAGCFAALLHRFAGPAAWPGALWFAAATGTDLFTGRLAFAMGIALGLAACLAAQRDRAVLAAVLGVATGATSPVAATFVALAGVALLVAGGSRRNGIALTAAPALTVLVLNLAFPVQGDARFGPVTLAGAVLAGAAVWAAAGPSQPVLRAGALLYAAGCIVAFLVPTPLGGTAGRLAALVAGPLVLTLLLARRVPLRTPAMAAAALGVAVALAWQWGPVRRDLHDATAAAYAPSTREAFHAPLVEEIRRRSPEPVRVEIPLTATHYEALWVARDVPIARGWLRQVDRARNALFYDGDLTSARYERWLRDNGIAWVALPAAPLDGSAREEAAIIRARPPYLTPVWSSPEWALFWVEGSPGLVSGPGRVVRLDDDALLLQADRAGSLHVRVRHSRYWRVVAGDACVGRAPEGWLAVEVARPGRVELATRLGSPRRLGGQPQCP
jgi:hypothetical protein